MVIDPLWPSDAAALPFFKDVSASDRENLFIRKLQICSIVFDFADTAKYVGEREIKRRMLLEMVDFIQSGLGTLTDPIHQHLVHMVSDNIFRCLPPASHGNPRLAGADPDEDDTYVDPAWPHLEIIYELLLRYIVSSNTDVKLAKRYIDHSFVTRLFYLFDSEDHREREYLKTILHRIYGKFMAYRPFIRKGISNVFSHFILTQKHNGIGELLEIYGTIINGFTLPMKEEHKSFLIRALIPLHKPKSVASYHQQLSYCVTQYVEKDCKLADTVIKGLLKYWPVSGYQKEILFLAELQEVLLLTESEEFQRCMGPLSRKIGRCVTSSHFQVAEYALFFWNNHHIVTLMAHNRNVIFPIIYGALEKNSQSHWNQTVQQLTNNVMTMLIEMDNQLFEECRKQYLEKETRAECLEQQRELTWKRLEEIAEQQQRELR